MLTQRIASPASRRRWLLGAALAALAAFVLTRPAGAAAGAASSAVAVGSEAAQLKLWQAIVLGVVEGVTEYLPVSSTGHLLITTKLLGLNDTQAMRDAADSYAIVIQVGAILAVLGIYRDRFALMISGVLGRSREGLLLVRSLIIATVPAVVIALIFDDWIKAKLLGAWPVTIAWLVGGVVILVFVHYQDRLNEHITSVASIPPLSALIIGFAQAIAMWPGTSRSFVTLLGAMLLGCSIGVAVEFAFLLGFVTLTGASMYELAKHGSEIFDQFGVVSPLVGVVAAGVAAFASVRWMIGYLQKHPLTIFGWYRLAIGALSLVLLLTGVIDN
ncbi:MAG: undecaprenyl-diphosphate phosphatase [Microthrixaceae bacterium]|nr:undecaprenyl-diphosphate phosphatase [Microthrixaceae bacterium]